MLDDGNFFKDEEMGLSKGNMENEELNEAKIKQAKHSAK